MHKKKISFNFFAKLLIAGKNNSYIQYRYCPVCLRSELIIFLRQVLFYLLMNKLNWIMITILGSFLRISLTGVEPACPLIIDEDNSEQCCWYKAEKNMFHNKNLNQTYYYKNRIKDVRNIYEIPTLLFCEQGKPEWEN